MADRRRTSELQANCLQKMTKGRNDRTCCETTNVSRAVLTWQPVKHIQMTTYPLLWTHTPSTADNFSLRLKVIVKGYSSLWETIAELQSITCNMESHSVNSHPTRVNVPYLNPSQTGWYSTYLPQRVDRLS